MVLVGGYWAFAFGQSEIQWTPNSLQKKQANTACTRRVGVAAFSSSLRGLELVPAKWRYLLPPTRPAARDLRRVTHTVGQFSAKR